MSGSIKSLVSLCAAGLFLCSGCASNTMIMTPPVKAPAVPEVNSTVYRVSKVTVPIAPYTLRAELNSSAFSDRFAAQAEARYPGLFKNSPEAVPLHVQIEIAEEVHDGVALATFMCTLGVFGGLLPSVPWTTEWQIKVGPADRSGIRHPAEVRAVHRGWWTLFSPCGLLPIPGEGDLPPVSTVGTGGPGMVPPELQQYVIRSMVDLLAGELIGGNPVPVTEQSALLTPAQSPASLVLPAETVAPF